MTDKKSTITFANDSAQMPTMQKVPAHGDLSINSAQIPKMQAVPSSATAAQSTQQKPSATADKE